MSSPHHEDPRVAKQLNRLDTFNQFISEIATAIVSSNDEFEDRLERCEQGLRPLLFAQSKIHRLATWTTREEPR